MIRRKRRAPSPFWLPDCLISETVFGSRRFDNDDKYQSCADIEVLDSVQDDFWEETQ